MHVLDGYIPVVSNKALTKTNKIVHIPDTKVMSNTHAISTVQKLHENPYKADQGYCMTPISVLEPTDNVIFYKNVSAT